MLEKDVIAEAEMWSCAWSKNFRTIEKFTKRLFTIRTSVSSATCQFHIREMWNCWKKEKLRWYLASFIRGLMSVIVPISFQDVGTWLADKDSLSTGIRRVRPLVAKTLRALVKSADMLLRKNNETSKLFLLYCRLVFWFDRKQNWEENLESPVLLFLSRLPWLNSAIILPLMPAEATLFFRVGDAAKTGNCRGPISVFLPFFHLLFAIISYLLNIYNVF